MKGFNNVTYGEQEINKEFPKLEACSAVIAEKNGKKVLVIVGFYEAHFIDEDGTITYTKTDPKGLREYLNDKYTFVSLTKELDLNIKLNGGKN